MFKQFLQARALGYCQIDSCRLGGVNEVLLVMLMAKKFGVPVWPHAGGVGLCEYVQHLSIIDYVCISASLEDRLTEYSDHLHDIFVDQIQTRDGRYIPPTAPGYSVTMKPETLAEYEFPLGRAWSGAKR
jgi:L-fuconate dehydratase